MASNTVYAIPVRDRQNCTYEKNLDNHFDKAKFDKEQASFKPPIDLYDAIARHYNKNHGLEPEMLTRSAGIRGEGLQGPVFEKPLPHHIALSPVDTEVTMGLERKHSAAIGDDKCGASIDPEVISVLPLLKQPEVGERSDDAVISARDGIVEDIVGCHRPEGSRVRPTIVSLDITKTSCCSSSASNFPTPDSTAAIDVDVDTMCVTPQAKSSGRKAWNCVAHNIFRNAKLVKAADHFPCNTARRTCHVVACHSAGFNTKGGKVTAVTKSAVVQDPNVADAIRNLSRVIVSPRSSGVSARQKTHPCTYDDCSQVCSSAGDLRRHMESRAHKAPSYQCLACDRRPYTRIDALRRHHRTQPACKRKHLSLLISPANAQAEA